MPDILQEALGVYLGDPVVALVRIGTGHSRAMFRAATASGDRLVVRVEQGGVFGTSGAEEFAVMRALYTAGFPVARVRNHESDVSVLGRPFFVMDFVAGAQNPDGGERAVDASTARAFVRCLDRLHALDWRRAQVPFETVPDRPQDATHLQIERWHAVAAQGVGPADPLLDEAAAWLHRYAPPLDRLCIVHGDAGPGNFVHADGEVLAVTDWEFAHLGDPAEDWSYCAVMRGASTMSTERWLELFAADAGVQLSASQWKFWEAFNLFKGACANRTTLALFVSGANRAPNMAIIGTALHQVFLRRLATITEAAP